jgi:hypothetical protein
MFVMNEVLAAVEKKLSVFLVVSDNRISLWQLKNWQLFN